MRQYCLLEIEEAYRFDNVIVEINYKEFFEWMKNKFAGEIIYIPKKEDIEDGHK